MITIVQILIYLIQTLFSLYLVTVLLRFLLQMTRADFYNPISQFLVKITNPLLLPLRKVIPGYAGLDLASLFLALMLQALGICALLLLTGKSIPGVLPILLWSALGIVGLLVNIYFFAILAMIILSWVAQGKQNPALSLLHQITEPVMAPVRKLLPAMGGMDFSPILIFILINVIQIVLGNLANAVGLSSGLVIGL
jgi:YggT family protein